MYISKKIISRGINLTKQRPIVTTTITGGNVRDLLPDAIRSAINLADIFVIIDTGITDDSLDLIRNMVGDKLRIFNFEWIDDFAAARQFALKCAEDVGGKWAITLDTDERLLLKGGVSGFLKELAITGDTFNRGVAMVSGGGYGKSRVFKLPSKVRWTGPIHEVARGGRPRILKCISFREVPKDDTQYNKKLERDKRVLLQWIKGREHDSRWWFYLGQTFGELGDLDNAIEYYRKCAEKSGWAEEIGWARLKIGEYLIEKNKIDEGVKEIMQGFFACPNMAELPWTLAKVSEKREKWEDVIIWCNIVKTIVREVDGLPPRIGFKNMLVYKGRIVSDLLKLANDKLLTN